MNSDTRITRRKVSGVIKDLRQRFFGVNGYLWLAAVEKLLKDGLPDRFPIWKSIHLGGFKNVQDLRQAIIDNGCQISDWANDLLGRLAFKLVAEEMNADLVVVSVGELGFKDGATRKEIYDRAIELGLEPCPAEVGPQLRLQYKDQPLGEWLLIAIEPIADSDGILLVFDVRHSDDGLWLLSSHGNPDDFWRAGCRWVFLRRK